MTPGVPGPRPDIRRTGQSRPTGRHLRGAKPQGSLGIAGRQPSSPNPLLAPRGQERAHTGLGAPGWLTHTQHSQPLRSLAELSSFRCFELVGLPLGFPL